jgi:hypothetical protein
VNNSRVSVLIGSKKSNSILFLFLLQVFLLLVSSLLVLATASFLAGAFSSHFLVSS